MSKSDEIKMGDIKFTPYKDGLAVIPHKEETTSISADEMFEKLGYKKLVGETTEVFKLSRASKNIYFSKLINRIRIDGEYDFIDMEELQAINKKCKELGWI